MTSEQLGMMMDFPLTTQHFLWRMRNVHPRSKVVSVQRADGEFTTVTFADAAARSERLAAALFRRGVVPGDRVATFAWNSAAHMEVYLGVMSMGAVLHTINLRLHDEQIIWMARHAHDRVLIVDDVLAPQIFRLLERIPQIELIVVIGDGDLPATDRDVIRYDDLVNESAGDYRLPLLDERSPAALCYTSGTTGDPKGVLYSHRSIALHSLIMVGVDVFGVAKHDVVLATVSLFHAMGWGLPFIAVLSGAELIMPGRFLQPAALAKMIPEHKVTWSSGVPTIWTDLIRAFDESGDAAAAKRSLTTLRKLILGGSQVPAALVRRMADDYDVEVISGWGMTETLPGVAVANTDPRSSPEDNLRRQVIAGRVSPFYEIRLLNDAGEVAPHDGVARGEIEVRGPVVASGYYGLEPTTVADRFGDGWLRTGDIGTVDPEGWVTLVDRAKDMIKSGGEWISSVDLEQAIQEHPDVIEVVVVGRPDTRWTERPHAFVVVARALDHASLREFLVQRVPKWWVPDTFDEVASIPRTTTGKHDKKALRALLDPTPRPPEDDATKGRVGHA
ncbi:long-chain-fatty-acid--CoA ligase [Microbacterium rhizomatis]|uniref:Long-chain fatty acid--CoA ligase n=1 Tax=Microbacterium rhizomatis TaxID=1631477 RepID=A0A5J5IX95_9MICO|nr:long-chain-fatty-acid--CoA ligase [Microbacterium rhizomatis]KAA9105920.1 long-chain fatty acid--CoA ligase [Microbacterium rhizomatis]